MTARYAGSSTFGESESVTLSGPTEPATKRGLSGVRAVQRVGGRAREPRALEAHLRGDALERVVGLADRRRRERVRRRDVGARLEVRVVDLRDDVGRRQVQEVGVALDVVRVRREALAAVLLLGQLAAVDEHAPRPVEHEDPLGEELSRWSRMSFTKSAPA